jgi:hypothetical protein
MRNLQGSTEKAEIERFRALSVLVGVARPYELKTGRNPERSAAR